MQVLSVYYNIRKMRSKKRVKILFILRIVSYNYALF